MKKISNWSWAGYAVGGIFALGSFIRYYILMPDFSQCVIGVSIGAIVMGLAFLYNRTVEQGNSLKAIEDYLSDKHFENKR